MKKFLFAALLFPLISFAQDCKLRASLGGHEGISAISKKELPSIAKLEVKSDCAGTEEAAVISYEFTVKLKGNAVSYTGTGALITTQMRVAMDALQPGSKIFFDNVRVKENGGKEKTVPGLTLTLKP